MSTGMGRPVRAGVSEHASGLEAFRESPLRWPHPHPHRVLPPLDAGLWRGALEASSHATLIADAEGRIRFVNQAAARLLRRAPDELSDRLLRECLIALDDRGQDQPGNWPHVTLPPHCFEVRLADGRVASATQRPLSDRWDRTTHVCIELEERVESRAGATLELIGRLAGELAHDINNQLSAALNYVFVLQRRLGAAPELAPHLSGLHDATWQAAMLADGLKLVARKRVPERAALQLEQVVNQVAPLLRHLVRGARVEVRGEPELPEIHAPLAYAEQLIITLALTALRRGAGDRGLIVRVAGVRGPDAVTRVRLSYELVHAQGPACDPQLARAAASLRSTHHGALRRAIRLCGARLGHDARRVWVDFE